MDFSLQFPHWLDAAASQTSPDIAAFSFNLYEPAGVPGVKFGIELIGAASFSPDDPDWPCDEIWSPDPRGIDIPLSFSGSDWEACLAKAKALVADYLSSPSGHWLQAGEAVGIGFVDGDLEVIWTREP
ncbi:hypothetical protein DZC30_19975 [Comamonas testosteroni]|uniref:Uncharacterized protein n=1 Tax=Comamonas testosteroni TaxID=285 RepID=A0A373F8T3_COMTE|nr:hypothetical protein [Comamonas testosteroni]RGE40593.1 hypothetical protein DZC30_19975 [Comamonas testosteroni]